MSYLKKLIGSAPGKLSSGELKPRWERCSGWVACCIRILHRHAC